MQPDMAEIMETIIIGSVMSKGFLAPWDNRIAPIVDGMSCIDAVLSTTSIAVLRLEYGILSLLSSFTAVIQEELRHFQVRKDLQQCSL